MPSQDIPEVRPLSKKVYIGMSGGVDSSVSAALLKRAGYDVTGVFIKVWQPDWLECNWREDRRDAMRVAAHLGIPFVTHDLEKEYKKDVVDYMIDEYKAGRTPNPDVMCNKSVKFGAFYDWAIANGADYVATGHYAQIMNRVECRKVEGEGENGSAKDLNLVVSADENKDQSYFLWTLRTEQLSKVLFPIGDMTKPEVRELARKFKLPTAEKKDSQGLCFIGKVDMKEFLSHYIETKQGDVLDENGKGIGTHPGALLFTIGERHGFVVNKKTPTEKPYFVVAKDNKKNTITVSDRDVRMHDSLSQKIEICNTNWIGGTPIIGKKYSGRSRYRQPLENLVIEKIIGGGAVVAFDRIQSTITPGQSIVIYDGQVCMGGGVIV